MRSGLAIAIALWIMPASTSFSAEKIPGFYPGIWIFSEKRQLSAGEIEALCRESPTIVTLPNKATTLLFDKLEGSEAADGKTLRGKVTYIENCPDFVGNEVVCAARDPSSTSILPSINSYSVRKLSNDEYEIKTTTQASTTLVLYPQLCPPSVIEALKATAILPDGVLLEP